MPALDNPSVAIVGAGGMGALFGSILSDGGLDVVLVDTDRDHVQAMQESGLRIAGFGGDRRAWIPASTDFGAIADRDLVLFQCKANNTSDAAREAAKHLQDGAVVVSLQNGLGNEEAIAAEVGEKRVLGGLTTMAGLKAGPGMIRDFSRAPTYIGEMPAGASPRAAGVAGALTAAGLETHAKENIRREIWNKLLSNIALSALSAATNRTQVEVRSVPELRDAGERALDEALAVAEACSLRLNRDDAINALELISAPGGTGENKSSLCVDLLNKRATEVDYIYGSVIELGRERGVPVPTLETLHAVVKGLERNFMGNSQWESSTAKPPS